MDIRKKSEKYIDWKLVFFLAIFYTVFNIVYIIKIAYFRYFTPYPPESTWYQIIFQNIIFDWVVVLAFMTFIASSTKRLLDKKVSWKKIFTIHLILSLVIGIVIRILGDIHRLFLGEISIAAYDPQASITRMFRVIELNFLIYFAMVFIIYTYYYLQQVKKSENQKNTLEKQLIVSRIKMLSSQLQPHFLFNTLNSISSLVEMDQIKAQDTIADLSDFLREILYNRDSPTIPLKKELETLDYYLNILNVRFSDHLEIHKDIQQEVLDIEVPSLIFQPIIENSIKHGYSYNHRSLKIYISAYEKDDFLFIEVKNNGEQLDSSHSYLLKKGMGLANINDRLNTLYEENYRFSTDNCLEGVKTIISFPINQATASGKLT